MPSFRERLKSLIKGQEGGIRPTFRKGRHATSRRRSAVEDNPPPLNRAPGTRPGETRVLHTGDPHAILEEHQRQHEAAVRRLEEQVLGTATTSDTRSGGAERILKETLRDKPREHHFREHEEAILRDQGTRGLGSSVTYAGTGTDKDAKAPLPPISAVTVTSPVTTSDLPPKADGEMGRSQDTGRDVAAGTEDKISTGDGVIQDRRAMQESMTVSMDDMGQRSIPTLNIEDDITRSAIRPIPASSTERRRMSEEAHYRLPESEDLGLKRASSADEGRDYREKRIHSLRTEDITAPLRANVDDTTTETFGYHFKTETSSKTPVRQDEEDRGYGSTTPKPNLEAAALQAATTPTAEGIQKIEEDISGVKYGSARKAKMPSSSPLDNEYRPTGESYSTASKLFASREAYNPYAYAESTPRKYSPAQQYTYEIDPEEGPMHKSITLGGKSCSVLSSQSSTNNLRDFARYGLNAVTARLESGTAGSPYEVIMPPPSLRAPVMGVEDEGDYYKEDPARVGAAIFYK